MQTKSCFGVKEVADSRLKPTLVSNQPQGQERSEALAN